MAQDGTVNAEFPELAENREKVVPAAVRSFARGGCVLVMDDFDRENECDLIVLGETITPMQMAFMIKHSTGIICVVAEKDRLEHIGLYPAAHDNTDKNATNFYVATDYLPTTTTGVSASDRCETVRAFCREDSQASDFSKPGHMFPLCPRPGGVLERGGHTESAYDLCRLAGKQRVAAIGELMREDGEMLRLRECLDFSKKHNIPLITVEELRAWVKEHGAEPVATDDLPSECQHQDLQADIATFPAPAEEEDPFDKAMFPELAEDRDDAVPTAVCEFARGEFVLVMDDFDRENECDLVVLGETLTPDQMAFMIKHSTGIVCTVAEKSRLEKLGLYPAARMNTDKNATNFYIATDYLPATTTGVSAKDRCETVLAFCREDAQAEDFSKPGHMFPLCPRPGGVQERGGHTESAFDLCRLAGKKRVAAIGELMREDGEMMRLRECLDFSKKYSIPLITVEELRTWTSEHGAEPISAGLTVFPLDRQTSLESPFSNLEACSTCTMPVRLHGSFGEGMRLEMFNIPGPLPIEVVAAIKGEVAGKSDVAVRIHSECFTGEVLRSAKCDCGLQLEKYLTVMGEEPCAVLLYIRGHEGRGIGLAAKIAAYRLQTEEKLDTVDSNVRLGFAPDLRDYAGIVEVIVKLGIKSVRLFSNNKAKARAVREHLPCKCEPLKTVPLPGNRDYLKTKEERMDHTGTMELDELRGGNIEWPRFGDYAGFHVVIVSTAWNRDISAPLVEGCEAALMASHCAVTTVEVPGALDLVAGCRSAANRDPKPNAVVALGTYVRGDTDTSQMHYQATISALQELNVVSAVPVVTGVVFCNTKSDAKDKSSATLGGTWAKNALQMISLTAQ